MKKDYKKSKAVAGPDQLVEFVSDEIKLDIPKKGITLEGGWKITPQIAPVVIPRISIVASKVCY